MKKRKISKELLIGLFTATVFIVGYLGLNWLKNKNLFSGDYKLTAIYDYADGIENTASVMTRGFKIGTVEKVALDLEAGKITLTMNIFGEYKLQNNATATITSSLLGTKSVDIEMVGQSTGMLMPNDTIKTNRKPDMVTTLMADLPTLMGNLNGMMRNLNNLTSSLDNAFDDNSVNSLKATLSNVEGLTADLKNVVSSESANIKSAISNIESLTTSLNEMMPSVAESLENIESVTGSLSESTPQLLLNAITSLNGLSTMLRNLNNGTGSAGQLMQDKALYDNMSETLENLAVLLEDVKANPKKYINVSVFGGKNK